MPASTHPQQAQHPTGTPSGAPLAQLGHQADLNMINNMVDQLCQQNAENRRDYDKLILSMAEMREEYEERMAVIMADPSSAAAAEAIAKTQEGVRSGDMEKLKQERDELHRLNEEAEEHSKDMEGIARDYDDVQNSVMIKVREFAAQHHSASLAWHEFYGKQIQDLRDQNLQLRLEHSSWQEHLGTTMEYARKALRAQSEYESPMLSKIAGQRRQIVVMRRLLGWENKDLDSDDEEELKDDQAEEARREMDRLAIESERHAAEQSGAGDSERRSA